MPEPVPCPGCGTEIAANLLACPSCHRLVHRERLEELAATAAAAERSGDLRTALGSWRDALDLLPPGSRQADVIGRTIAELSARVDAGEGRTMPAPSPDARTPRSPTRDGTSAWKKGAAGLGALGLFLWKFKAIAAFLLTKGKLLLLGLTKSTTVFSMLLSLGVYWTAWGWAFALGLVLSIYVHEMGHVAALRAFGIRATAPAFIPGLGAVVRLEQYPATPVEEARVGLAGPVWGLGAAVVCYVVHLATGSEIWAAIAQVGAWINLFNLLPVPPLDGGRGFRALTRRHRWIAVGAITTAWFVSEESLLVLLLLAGLFQAIARPGKAGPADRVALIQYVGLVLVLSLLCMIPVDPGAHLAE